MKISELIKKLSQLKKEHGDLEVFLNKKYTEHICGDGYCYCSNEDHISNFDKGSFVFVKDMSCYENYKEQKLTGIVVVFDEY